MGTCPPRRRARVGHLWDRLHPGAVAGPRGRQVPLPPARRRGRAGGGRARGAGQPGGGRRRPPVPARPRPHAPEAGPVTAPPEGSGEPQGGAPVDREGSGEPQGGAPVGRSVVVLRGAGVWAPAWGTFLARSLMAPAMVGVRGQDP